MEMETMKQVSITLLPAPLSGGATRPPSSPWPGGEARPPSTRVVSPSSHFRVARTRFELRCTLFSRARTER